MLTGRTSYILSSHQWAEHNSQSYAYEPVYSPEVKSHRSKSFRQAHFSGWRIGAVAFTIAAFVVLLANIIIAYYATRHHGELKAGFVAVYSGNCARSKQLNTWIHFTINVLSSILLSGSNYCMQVLSAPTRDEIDNAHAKGRWLDIGIPSLRNFGIMPKQRKFIWATLVLSSVPLHLVYNSVFSQSSARQEYMAALVTKDFMDGAPFPSDYLDDVTQLWREIQANSSRYERLENVDCVKAYDRKAVLDRKTVLVVTSAESWIPESSILATDSYVGNDVEKGTWMCPCELTYDGEYCFSQDSCDMTSVLDGSTPWAPFTGNVTVDYCLSEYIGEKCTLDFSFGILATVCVCNLIKMICMLTLCITYHSQPVLTIGDAVSSFLDRPDYTTRGFCLAGRREIEKMWKGAQSYGYPVVWQPRRLRWFSAASRWRWVLTIGLCIFTMILAAALLGIGFRDTRASGFTLKELWNSGIGAAKIDDRPAFVITYGHRLYQNHRLVQNILLANLPQLILSCVYISYNTLLTSMLLSHEWQGYSSGHKSLRTSSPCGKQRSTYYLQLPYRYAIPLIIMFTLLHWLTSQAIFLDRRTSWTVWGPAYEDTHTGSVATVGYSPLGVILCLVTGFVMTVALLVLGFRRYKASMPLASSCSASISAACHPPEDDVDAAVLALTWGVVGYGENRIGHCSFTSHNAPAPVVGRLYAGSSIL